MKLLFLRLGLLIKTLQETKGKPDPRPLEIWKDTHIELCLLEEKVHKNAELSISFEKIRNKYEFDMYSLFFQGYNTWGSKNIDSLIRTFSNLLNELIILDEKFESGRYLAA